MSYNVDLKRRPAYRGRPAAAAGKVKLQRASRMLRQSQLAPSRVIAKESGFIDVASNTYACDTTGTITLLNAIPQGASVNQRVGKRVILKSLQARGALQSGTTTVIADTTVLIIYDRQPGAALPAITDILDTINSRSFNNDGNSDRFKIVRRFDNLMLGNTTAPTTGREGVNFDEFIDLKGMPTVYKALGTGAIADISSGALYLVTVGNLAAGTTAGILVSGFRTRFIDQ